MEPSALVRRFAPRLVQPATGVVLDVGGGAGRNSFYLASLGASVVCIDKNLRGFQERHAGITSRERGIGTRVSGLEIDLARDPWPFAASSVSAIINVHFLMPELFASFSKSLKAGGLLLIETIGGQGENYLLLPAPGKLKRSLRREFEFEYYQERNVGPSKQHVAVRLLARKRDASALT